jgi:hypothetical protein
VTPAHKESKVKQALKAFRASKGSKVKPAPLARRASKVWGLRLRRQLRLWLTCLRLVTKSAISALLMMRVIGTRGLVVLGRMWVRLLGLLVTLGLLARRVLKGFKVKLALLVLRGSKARRVPLVLLVLKAFRAKLARLGRLVRMASLSRLSLALRPRLAPTLVISGSFPKPITTEMSLM